MSRDLSLSRLRLWLWSRCRRYRTAVTSYMAQTEQAHGRCVDVDAFRRPQSPESDSDSAHRSPTSGNHKTDPARFRYTFKWCHRVFLRMELGLYLLLISLNVGCASHVRRAFLGWHKPGQPGITTLQLDFPMISVCSSYVFVFLALWLDNTPRIKAPLFSLSIPIQFPLTIFHFAFPLPPQVFSM